LLAKDEHLPFPHVQSGDRALEGLKLSDGLFRGDLEVDV